MHPRQLGRIGVWLPLHLPTFSSVDRTRRLAALVERLGYGSLWSGEVPDLGREPFAHHGSLLAATRKLVTGTGIAHLGARTALTMNRSAATLADGFPGRFVLGIGGHGSAGAGSERTGVDPVTRMTSYLDGMDAAAEQPGTWRGYVRVLAALGPRMLELAAERTDGAHSFLAPVEHTAYARARLGPDKLLLPAVNVMLTSDRAEVRSGVLAMVGGEPGRLRGSGYYANLRRFGYRDSEIDQLTDRVLDALVAWGDEDTIAARVKSHHEAGASSVLIHPIPSAQHDIESQLSRLAGAESS